MEDPKERALEPRANGARNSGEHAVLELIASGSELHLTLQQLCAAVEQASPGTLCSILLLEEDGIHLRHAAGPSLPEAYSAAINGIAIGPAVGSCGTAAYRRARVIVTDIEHDPLWAGYEPLARSFGLRACASMPIFAGSTARLLGTFAIYHREAGPFREDELLLVESMSVLAAIAVVHDERERALRKSEERRERAAAILGQIEALIALDGKWLRVSPMLCELLARTEQDLLTSHLQDVLHPDDLAADMAQFKRLVRGEVEQWERTSRLLRKDGQRVWASLSFSAGARDERGKPTNLLVFIKDVSEQKRTEETLRATQKMHSLGLLAAGISHDLNNLLAAILANVDVAKMHAAPASPVQESLQDAQLVVHRAAELTRQLLAYAGKGTFTTRKSVNLNQAIKEVTKMLSTSFLKKIRVTFELRAEPAVIFADIVQMKQVVMNLVINATEAMRDGNGTILVRTANERLTGEVAQTRFVDSGIDAGEYVVLEVIDTGSGMTPETLQSVFEPFFTTKRQAAVSVYR